jgi:hypothetical protein
MIQACFFFCREKASGQTTDPGEECQKEFTRMRRRRWEDPRKTRSGAAATGSSHPEFGPQKDAEEHRKGNGPEGPFRVFPCILWTKNLRTKTRRLSAVARRGLGKTETARLECGGREGPTIPRLEANGLQPSGIGFHLRDSLALPPFVFFVSFVEKSGLLSP